jgi:N-methylhydantoinase B
MATVYYCLKAMADPALSINEGMYRPIQVIAPQGSIVNPLAPAGVSSRNLTSMILADVMIDALSQAIPSRGIAAGGPYQGIILGGWDPLRNRFFVDYENFAGGHGANVLHDGLDVAQLHMTNTANLPIEVMELEFPVRVERYEIIVDSGGAGRLRGGCGVNRELRMLTDQTSLTVRSARQRFAALGKDGGHAGSTGAFYVNPKDRDDQKLRSTFSEMALAEGDLLRILTPGGGGMGNPKLRAPEEVATDVREGKISHASAREIYGVALDEISCIVDLKQTELLRIRV